MRRLLSILLLCLFGLPMVTPLLALGQTTEGRLPACCRKGGDHHCMGGMAEQDDAGRQISPNPRFGVQIFKCPYTPGVLSVHVQWTGPTVSPCGLADLLAQPVIAARNATMRRIARNRSCPKRGPPKFA